MLSVLALPCPDWDESELAGASMMTVLVNVAVRPFWSVATWLGSRRMFEASVPFRFWRRRPKVSPL